ncbi:fimbrial protein [Salmonella enterica]|nr:fimbrial protein [Salmonella enterica]ELI0025981.1 fimbrial protein [Salmonella enterica]ELI0151778.1 fimbrial protein [Salmonella enterica]
MKIKTSILSALIGSSLFGFPLCHATALVTSSFEITNRTIDSENIVSDMPGFSFQKNNDLYIFQDNHADANLTDIRNYGNQQAGYSRTNSLVQITMKGMRLGHTFTLSGKLGDASVQISGAHTNGFFNTAAKNGCISVIPDTSLTQGTKNPIFGATTNTDVLLNCISVSNQYNFTLTPPSVNIGLRGLKRIFYLDVARLQNEISYRKAPPDTYKGVATYRGEGFINRVGTGITFDYINDVTIIKKPYFEGVTLPPGENVFDTRAIGQNIIGNLTIPYVINGQFTPYDQIQLKVSSLNNFSLINPVNSARIPYSLNTTLGSKKIELVKQGSPSMSVSFTNLPNDNYSLQGKFDAAFSISKNNVTLGEYTDTITAVFNITLGTEPIPRI